MLRRVLLGISGVAVVAALVMLFIGAPLGHGDAGAVVLVGTIEAREVAVAAEVAGRIVALDVDEGARVRRGDRLARIDARELELRARALEARVAAAEAEVADLRSLPRKTEVSRHRSRVREAELVLQRERAELERDRGLYANAATTRRQLEDREASFHLAEQRLETARRELEEIEAGARPTQIAAAAARASELSRELELARLEIERATLAAPIDGTVLRRDLEEGELADRGSTVVTLVELSELWVELVADEQLHGRIQIGDAAEVRAEAFAHEVVPGRVVFVADRHAFTPREAETRNERARLSYRVKVKLEKPSTVLKPGMFVAVTLRSAALDASRGEMR